MSPTGSAASPRKACPIIGDDIKSQVGATITHRVLTRLFMDRGVRLDRTYQLNFGGNTDFLNMLERERLESKKISKTNAVTSMLDYEIDPDDIHVGPSDHVPWLLDRKWCYIRMEGTTFGDVPLNAELKLEVWDSPNSAGVITDAIRCLKLGLDRGLAGTLVAPSSYFMKSPPQQIHDDIAFNRVEAFIRGEDNETLVGTEKLPRQEASARWRHRAPRSRPRPSSADGHGLDGRAVAAAGTVRIEPGTTTPSAPGGVAHAPHRRSDVAGRASTRAPPARERAVVVGYRSRPGCSARARSASACPSAGAPCVWPISPGRPSGASSWPTPRTCSGGPPTTPPCDAWRGRVYETYARFIIELMRLPTLPAEAPAAMIDPRGERGVDAFVELWAGLAREGRGIIALSVHIGSIEPPRRPSPRAASRPTAWPTIRSYPELFEVMNAQRRRWGIEIFPWRNLRRVFSVLREPAMLGLLVDWGYRSDGVPVRLFGEWTTLPAGPAMLAAKTNAVIVPVVCRRQADGPFTAEWLRPDRGRWRQARPRSPRATQAIADAIEDMVRPAPEQWYTFKPIWPATAGGGRVAGSRAPARPRDAEPERARLGVLRAATWLACRLPDATAPPDSSTLVGAASYLAQPDRRDLVRRNLTRICTWLVAEGRATPRVARAVRDPKAMDRLVRDAFGHHARYYLELLRRQTLTPEYLRSADRLWRVGPDRRRLRRAWRLVKA